MAGGYDGPMVLQVVICGHRNVGSFWVRWQISLCYYKRRGVFVWHWCMWIKSCSSMEIAVLKFTWY